MVRLIAVALFFSSFAWAACGSYLILGSQTQDLKKINFPNTVVWKKTGKTYSVSKPLDTTEVRSLACEGKGYVLANDVSILSKAKPYEGSFYTIETGWNKLTTPKEGVDVIATFAEFTEVDFVYAYEKKTSIWAGYSPQTELMDKILSTRILGLRALEPETVFYVYARKPLRVVIRSLSITGECKRKAEEKGFATLINSGLAGEPSYNDDRTMSLTSRYVSHYKKGVYDDTRLALIYPKIDKNSNEKRKFGPAIPQAMLQYDKNYEGLRFYVYDFLRRECFEGVYPSIKLPPYPTLKKLK
jgi:hypothetical protein